MNNQISHGDISIPVLLLQNNEMKPATKVIWMILACYRDISLKTGLYIPRLRKITGFSRNTIISAVVTLRRIGWLQLLNNRSLIKKHKTVSMPAELITNAEIDPQAKLLLGRLKYLYGTTDKPRQYRNCELGKELGIDVKTVKTAANTLVRFGWLALEQTNRLAPIMFKWLNPTYKRTKDAISKITSRIVAAPYKGEAIMKELLFILIDSCDYHDNYRPDFLKNPETSENLELDRFYTCGVAFEFNGSQHSHASKKYDQATVDKQRHRDAIKQQLCAKNNIKLIVLTADDLSLSSILKAIRNLLPLVNLKGLDTILDYLEYKCICYRGAVLWS